MTLLATNCHQRGRHFFRSIFAMVLAISVSTLGIVPTPAYAAKEKAAKEKQEKQDKQDKQDKQAKKDPREMQAREAFAAGSYKEALDIYTKLYAEKLHPTYLRNIGRCYQNLHESDRAISSFREYLRKAKDMPADERAEVEGYIKEMDDAKQKAAAAEAERAKPVPLMAPPPPPPAQVTVVQSQPTPFYAKGWFWGVVAGVVVVGVVSTLAATGTFSSKTSVDCPSGTTCAH